MKIFSLLDKSWELCFLQPTRGIVLGLHWNLCAVVECRVATPLYGGKTRRSNQLGQQGSKATPTLVSSPLQTTLPHTVTSTSLAPMSCNMHDNQVRHAPPPHPHPLVYMNGPIVVPHFDLGQWEEARWDGEGDSNTVPVREGVCPHVPHVCCFEISIH